MQTLSDRTCIFAGATAGDGIDVVKALCQSGMNVVMTTHNVDDAERLVREIEEADWAGKCMYEAGENQRIAPETAVCTYQNAEKRFGHVDAIICNTGADGQMEDITSVTAEDLMRDFEHLAVGSFRMMQTALPFLRRGRNPRIIFMTTVEGCRGGTHESFSNAIAKGAVRALTLNAAARLAKENITVNAVSKGAILRVEGYPDGAVRLESRLDFIPLGRLGTSRDLASAVCYLLSEEADYVTGQFIEVNGGLNLGK